MNERVTPTGSSTVSIRSEYPFDIIEFYLSDTTVGEYLADISNPRICTGYMAASVPSADGSAHRYGRGQYFVVNRELAQRLVGPTGGAVKFPGTATEEFLQRWMEYLEEVRNQDEDILARLELAQAISRGSMNQAVVAVLHFPR
ncbi:hypothetical protein ABVF61_17630 [Roseibium sp. HPY-6]|uniref:hypothetical protein n=1 Tax=Roseibium sp. HPY-6 TaxID=3229852 RepID=UPI00338E1731